MKVLLVSPPYRAPHEGSLSVATLRPILEAAGHEVDELHGSTLFPFAGSQEAPALFHWNAQYAFGRGLTPWSLDDFVDHGMQLMAEELDPHNVMSDDRRLVWESFGVAEPRVRQDFRSSVLAAETCIDRMIQRALAGGPYPVVGFSTAFTTQVPAAILVARRLREVWPEVKLAFGGSACLEDQADGLLATFPEIDAACHTEGEHVVVPMFEALAGLRPLAEVAGIAWRDGAVVHHNPSPPLQRELDSLPVPAYDGFVAQLAASEWSASAPELFFETSRGCWWGEKSLCTFCGLNAEGLTFRSKSAERTLDEISTLYHRHQASSFLRAADNIVDFRFLKTVFPRLTTLATDPERPLQLFYETKSNMKPEQLEIMAAGGVREVQPGIESFSDDVLTLMRKGCTAMGQVQFVKWAAQAGLGISYNILVLNPGEPASAYAEMLELLPFIEHLPPPNGTPSVLLERFSPYHQTPDEFGITDVRPNLFFRNLFGDRADPRLAYKFDFDHAMYHDPEHMRGARAIAAAVKRWRGNWQPDLAYWVDLGDRVALVDRRAGAVDQVVLSGAAARLFVYLDQQRPRELLDAAFPDIDAQVLEALLLTWLHRKWICRIGERYLAVLPRKGPARGMATRVPTVQKPRAPGPVRLQLAG